uniref:Putative ovule protein n=1 Tax=Solanum chacoense TaxID=4108 RepID=A0A0V0I2M5_SOLCH
MKKIHKIELEKCSVVEESILKQKSGTKWLQLGDDNTAYFFATFKCGQVQNRIICLVYSQSDPATSK